MENFKSFGRKLRIPFFPGFTAITGPNGSGKSNIVDAILFVLGPKSSKVMRAGRLTDLIFNGGKKHKKPASYCKVSLVFDNSDRKMPVDSDEVVLTRMIKRAPLKNDPDNYYSYFYINSHAASFSDFVDLLTHARISGDGYNIVKQGDVTWLVEMGSVERRRIIDEIAGISTFDNDIKRAEKEKNEVEENLERIKIILNEISGQIRQLKKDRDEAYRYKELQEKLYETKAKIVYKKKQDVEGQIAEINNQMMSYEKERERLIERREKLKKEYTQLQQHLKEVENKISEAGSDEAREIKEKIELLRTDEIKIEEKINYSNDEILALKREQKEFENSLEKLRKEIEDLNTQHAALLNEIEEKENILREKEKKLSELKDSIAESDDRSIELTRELAKMREEYNEKQSEIHELKLKRDRFVEKIDAMDHQIAEMEETKSTYEFEIRDIEWQFSEYKKNRHDRDKKLKDLEKKLFDKKKRESDLTKQLVDIENLIRKLQREKTQLQAEIDAIQSIESRYNPAVNAILTARDSGELKGICGTVAELADVDKKYETAIEIAAGSRIQSIVVDDDQAAAAAIEYLRKKKLGRATFLPLNKMITGKPRGKALMAVRDPSSHGFAIDLVRFKDKYRGAFWYVFGDTVIVDTLSDARRLMGGVRLVDMKGDLIEASGAITGGSKPDVHISFGGIDHRQLEEITQKLQETIDKQETMSNELSNLKREIAELEREIVSLKNEVDADTQIQNLEVRKKEFVNKLKILTEELEKKVKEKEEFEKKKNDVVSAIEICEKRIKELDLLREEKGRNLLSGAKKELAQQARTLEGEVSDLQSSLRDLYSKQETLSKKIDLTEERKKEILSKIEEIKSEIKKLRSTVEELKKSRSQCQNELKALMNVEKQMTDKVKDLTADRDDIYKKTVNVENELDKINTRIESYLDLVTRAKYRLSTLEETIRELEQELSLYNVEIKDKKLPNIESLKETVRVIEENMRELEPVNMRALEEYEHQMERKKRFDEDVKHLKDQRKNLIKLVDEITAKKKERFFEVFDEINKNFKEIYAQLSEGGEAELLLEDEENVFDSGLTIRARPRGKKILRLSALSGGEKSIASLAFIFAIQQYDPSPFYVLDEIDMFLDGVNAETVSRMIKQNSEHSQFITVSLRKVVLKEANHIYGVTMQDTGISEMIGNIDPESVGPKGEIHMEERNVAWNKIG